jgi:hypothetical protein
MTVNPGASGDMVAVMALKVTYPGATVYDNGTIWAVRGQDQRSEFSDLRAYVVDYILHA